MARAALEDPRVRLVGVTDTDRNKADRDLGEIIGEGRLGVRIDPDLESMLRRARPEVAVVCTTSDVEALAPTLEACVAQGAHVVTTCENLADPEMALAQLEPGFEQRVRDSGLVVLATGVNPGFAMDRLPVMLTQATRNVRRVRVVRVVNAATRRAQLQAKIGIGMTPHEFGEAIQRGQIGHAGLSSSLRLLAKGLGITLEKTSEAFTPVIAEQATNSSVLGPVKAGAVRGIYQIARGYRARREIITLELTMALDEPNPRDTIDIVGEPPLQFKGELPGDLCTVATVLSAISVVVTMPPGLRTVLDVPLEQPEEPSARQSGPRRSRQSTQLPRKTSGARDEEPPARKRPGKGSDKAPDKAPRRSASKPGEAKGRGQKKRRKAANPDKKQRGRPAKGEDGDEPVEHDRVRGEGRAAALTNGTPTNGAGRAHRLKGHGAPSTAGDHSRSQRGRPRATPVNGVARKK